MGRRGAFLRGTDQKPSTSILQLGLYSRIRLGCGSRLMRPAMQTESIPNRRLPLDRYALGLLARNKDGSTMTMLSARRVPLELIDQFIAAGLAVTTTERAGLVDITRVKITEAGRRAL